MKKLGFIVVLASILMFLMLSGCSSEKETAVSYQEFQQLQARIADVEQQLSELKQSAAGLHLEESIAGGTVVDSEAKVTLAQYNDIKIGMTYDEIKEIIGGEGAALAETDKSVVYMYSGSGDSGANASFSFYEDKLGAKSQVGLK